MEERLTPMNKIVPGTKDWKCRVRVIKKLGVKQANNNPNKFQKLILGDGLGHTLDAVIFHDNIDRFEHVLQEGSVYMVKGAYVSDPKQYRNPIVTCNYQWTFRKDTSVQEEPKDSIPACGLSFNTTSSCKFHEFLSTKALINTACIVIAKQEPRVVQARGQSKVIREYAAIDTELEPFVVTFWEDSVSDEIYAKLEPISNRTPLLLLNFSVTPYYGLSLATNAQSIVSDDSGDGMLIELEMWKRENEEAINILVQNTNFFERKVTRSPRQPLQTIKVEQMLQTHENAYFNVKVKARLDNPHQNYFYNGCPICSTKTAATYGTEFMCYSTPCKNIRIANRSFRFSLTVFDVTGQAEVTFLGKEAQKVLGLDPNEFYQKQNEDQVSQADLLRKRLCDVVLLLKIKSRIFKDAPFFTADAIEILQDKDVVLFGETDIQRATYSDQGPVKAAKKRLIFHGSSDNERGVQANIVVQDKGKGKMYQEMDSIGCILQDSDSSDDGKPISEIFGHKKKNCAIVLSEDSENDGSDYALKPAKTENIGAKPCPQFTSSHNVINKKPKRKYVSKRGFVHLDLTEEPVNDDHWFSEDGDSSDHSEKILEYVEEPAKFKDVESHMPPSEILETKKKGKNISLKSKSRVIKDPQADTNMESATDHSKHINEDFSKSRLPLSGKLNQNKDKDKNLIALVTKHNKVKIGSQTPPVKSRSGRTIKKRILD